MNPPLTVYSQSPYLHFDLYSFAHSHVYSEGGDEVEKAVKALVQHVCVKTPDKADYRHRLAKVGCGVNAFLHTRDEGTFAP